jgi:hypothetical protein
MSRADFQKSVRMFHKFSEETMRRRGGDQAGRESIAALAAIEAVLKAERLLSGDLLEPLGAFTNLLQSSQLPPDFGDYSLGDALVAVEEAHAELRKDDAQHWEFEPELDEQAAGALSPFMPEGTSSAEDSEHATQLRRFVLDAAQTVAPKALLVVGALREPALPLAELCARFERVTLSDLDLVGLEDLLRKAVPEPLRSRVKLERYDPTGSYLAFEAGVKAAVNTANTEAAAELALSELLASYDVGAGSAGLSALEQQPDLAVSAGLLPELGRGYARSIATALSARGWDGALVERSPLAPALLLLRCLVEHHHILALGRRARSAVLVSPVSEVTLRSVPGKKDVAASEPHDLLATERLVERLPESVEVKAEQSWEWRRGNLLTLVEAVQL